MDSAAKLVIEIGTAVVVLVAFRNRIILALGVLFLPKKWVKQAIEKALNDHKVL